MLSKDFVLGAGTTCLILVLTGQVYQDYSSRQVQPDPAQKIAVHQPASFARLLESQAAQQPLKELIELGHDYFDDQAYAKAIDVYHQVLQQQPDNFTVLTDMGSAYFYLKMPHLAIEKYLEAIRVAPNHRDAYFNLGYAYLAIKQTEKARQIWLNAMLLESADESFKQRVQQILNQLKS